MKNCITPERSASNIAINLYNYFQKTNKSIEDIADDLGVATRTIYYWTSGQRIPNLNAILEITKYLSISVDDLLV
ncbi:MAG: helix-turn-helix transcriptional regulator [Bacilli bacterium]|nr:helix-turn-helix transcriptional regulator [Bacilli bacterium]